MIPTIITDNEKGATVKPSLHHQNFIRYWFFKISERGLLHGYLGLESNDRDCLGYVGSKYKHVAVIGERELLCTIEPEEVKD